MFLNLVKRGRSCSFFLFAQLVARHETTQILIPGPAFHEQRQSHRPRRVGIRHPRRQASPVSKTLYGNLGSHVSANAYTLSRHVESWRTVHAASIDEGNDPHFRVVRPTH